MKTGGESKGKRGWGGAESRSMGEVMGAFGVDAIETRAGASS